MRYSQSIKIDKSSPKKKDFRAAKIRHPTRPYSKIGNEVQSLLKKDAQQLSKGVDKEIAKLGLPSYFRDLSEKEEAFFKNRLCLTFLALTDLICEHVFLIFWIWFPPIFLLFFG